MYLAPTLLLLLFGYAQAQDANCNYEQTVLADRDYYIYSPNYPENYNAGVQCRWIGNCPVGYNCRLDCDDIRLPQTPSCSGDRLVISKNGDPLLISGDTYCGTGSLTAVSTGQRISVGLLVAQNSTGGRFICKLTAQVQSTTPSNTCQCGYQKQNRIVGGTETRPNEFPMMAAIVYLDEGTIKCGAVIISPTALLTAAHCVINKTVNDIAVVVGEHDVTTGADSNATKAFRVASIISHPLFTQANYDYDIAIVKVSGTITFSANVGPVCLPFKYGQYDFTGETVTVLGWGTLFPGGAASKVLRKVDLSVISQNTCRQSFSSVTPRQICTYARGKDACQDDSGGPLLHRDRYNGLLYHVGIVSYGRFCASSSPGINARITDLLNWIVSTAPDNYCNK